MRDVVTWMNTPIGRAVLVGVGAAIVFAGIIFLTGVAMVVVMVLGMVVLLVGAGLGGPRGVRHSRPPPDGGQGSSSRYEGDAPRR